MILSSRPSTNAAPKDSAVGLTDILDGIDRARQFILNSRSIDVAVDIIRGVLCGLGVVDFAVTASSIGVDVTVKINGAYQYIYVYVS